MGKKGKTWFTPVLLLAVAAGLAVRILLILKGRINSDEAIVGLMGMEIQKGRHFAFYWGQGYMGSLEAYAAALLFSLLGVSAAALKAVPAFFFLAAAWLHYLFADRVLGRGTALVMLGLLFFSPWVFTVWTVAPRGGYMEALAFGGAVLLLSARLRAGQGAGWGWYLLLGLFSGLGLWTHYFFAYYLAPLGLVVALPALLGKGRWARTFALLGGFLIGVSPVIVHNIRHSFDSLGMMNLARAVNLRSNLSNLVVRQMPTLLGANKISADGPLWIPVSWLVLGLYALALLFYPVAAWRGARRSGCVPLSVACLPLLVTATAAALFLGTGFGVFNTQRYLLPLYPLFALMLAAFLVAVAGRRPRLAALLAAVILAANAYGNWHYLNDKFLPQSADFNRDVADTLGYCRENGVRTAWASHWTGYVLTFLSRQELVVADVERERYEPFQRLVRESKSPGIIAEAYGREITSTLGAIGYQFSRHRAGRFLVFGNPRLRPAIGGTGGRLPVEIRESADGAFGPLAGGGILSLEGQRGGLSGSFALKEPRRINGLILSPGERRDAYPRSFTVETSLDGKVWEAAAQASTYIGGIYHLDRLRYERNGWLSVYFPPREAGFARLTVTHPEKDRPWAVVKAWVSTPSP